MRHLTRSVALLTASAVGFSTLAGATTGTANAAGPEPQPLAAGAAWLSGQLTNGLMHNDEFDFDDIGLSADAALGLAAVGGHEATVTEIVDAIEPRAEGEWYTSTFEGVTTVYAGSLAKAVVLAETTGQDPRAFGGTDLVARLEGRVATEPPIAGRIEDENNAFGDANVIGQAFAAGGLADVESVRAADALAFLVQQQCSEGYFRLQFTPDKGAADQSCDGGQAAEESAPDTDVTALTILALHDDVAAAAAVERAVDWLLDQQRRNGSFGGGTSTEAPNSNSTGLAGWALGTVGETVAAENAAIWVRQHQATDIGLCRWYRGLRGDVVPSPPPADDGGAIAYGRDALRAAREHRITDSETDEWRRATAQALPVLQWAPTEPRSTMPSLAQRYYKAGTLLRLPAGGAAPGDSICVYDRFGLVPDPGAWGQAVTNRQGAATVRIRLGRTSAPYLVESTDGVLARLHVLGRKRFPVALDRRVARGDRQVVRVRGLEEFERVAVRFRGKRVDRGSANRAGKFTSRFRVDGPTGRAEVTVLGQFPDLRRTTKTFRVTR